MEVLSTGDFVPWGVRPQGVLSMGDFSIEVLSTMGLCMGVLSTGDIVRWDL